MIILIQIDQELGLILGKNDAKRTFTTEWNTKYISAIISYGEKLRKSSVSEIISSMNSAGKSLPMHFSCCGLINNVFLQMRLLGSSLH